MIVIFILLFSFVISINSSAVKIKNLYAPDGTSGDAFGRAVGISGEFAISGAYLDNPRGSLSGSAYIFRDNGTSWDTGLKLSPVTTKANDFFGISTAIHGNVAICGASGDATFGTNSGAVYVFRYDGSNWVNETTLIASDAASGDTMGRVIDIYDNKIVAGAHADDVAVSNSGSLYVFTYNEGIWDSGVRLNHADPQTNDNLGWTVSMSKDVIVSGLPTKNSTGAAYVFRYNGVSWGPSVKIDPNNRISGENFGIGVSISNDMLAVGANFNTVNGVGAGAVYVYKYNGATWETSAVLYAPDALAGDNFGTSVSIDGYTLLVGAPGRNSSRGTAYLFTYDGTSWTSGVNLGIEESNADDQFGFFLKLRDTRAIIGARNNDFVASNAGSAYVFSVDPAPTQNPTVKPTLNPTASPTAKPTAKPTVNPTSSPTKKPTASPTKNPTVSPTKKPTSGPTISPSTSPTAKPTVNPTKSPSKSPSVSPSGSPSVSPSGSPSTSPSTSPSGSPSTSPTTSPSKSPTTSPTNIPSVSPTTSPSMSPSVKPTTNPTKSPNNLPTTLSPTLTPSISPSVSPSVSPSLSPSSSPSVSPSTSPSVNPSTSPSKSPSANPTTKPTVKPTGTPTLSPTANPTAKPTVKPTGTPTLSPTAKPTTNPTVKPSANPTVSPSAKPTTKPTVKPTGTPTVSPTVKPSANPTISPSTGSPVVAPTNKPTTLSPTAKPTTSTPTKSPTFTSQVNSFRLGLRFTNATYSEITHNTVTFRNYMKIKIAHALDIQSSKVTIVTVRSGSVVVITDIKSFGLTLSSFTNITSLIIQEILHDGTYDLGSVLSYDVQAPTDSDGVVIINNSKSISTAAMFIRYILPLFVVFVVCLPIIVFIYMRFTRATRTYSSLTTELYNF